MSSTPVRWPPPSARWRWHSLPEKRYGRKSRPDVSIAAVARAGGARADRDHLPDRARTPSSARGQTFHVGKPARRFESAASAEAVPRRHRAVGGRDRTGRTTRRLYAHSRRVSRVEPCDCHRRLRQHGRYRCRGVAPRRRESDRQADHRIR